MGSIARPPPAKRSRVRGTKRSQVRLAWELRNLLGVIQDRSWNGIHGVSFDVTFDQ